ncbi:MAG: phosphate ABC transporter permease PstA [Solirubrobacteraceae bacterium]
MATSPGSIRLGPIRQRRALENRRGWRLGDRLAYGACWTAGIALCVIAAAVVGYMGYRGIQYLSIHVLFDRPAADANQARGGGFLDPLIGSLLLALVGIAIATPLAVGVAVWLVEYGRPSWLARTVESGIEIVAGTPSIVLAIFGLVLFQQHVFAFLSFTAQGGAVFARSFFTAGAMMSLLALPLVFGATREALQSIPRHVREASYSLGKTQIATIRRVLIPAARPDIGTGVALGIGRIIGDTAIVVILLGATLQLTPTGNTPGISTLRGTGSTLTSYVYNNSPAGEGNAPQKAYAAAFVLLLIVIAINQLVDRLARGKGRARWKS